MKKTLIGVTVGVFAAAGVALAVMPELQDYLWPRVEAADAPVPPPAPPSVPVTTGTVEAKDVPVILTSIGTVQAYNMVLIRTRVDGQIVKVDFQEGQEIKAGDPLVHIDPRPYKAVYDQASAKLETDQATLGNATANYNRDAQIVNSNLAISRQQFDNDKTAVATGQGLVDSDKALVEAAKVNLDYCDIHAPISGRLGVRLVDAGNIVHANDTAGLVTITQTKPIYVTFTMPQEYLHKIHEKEALAPLTVEAYGNDNVTLLSTGKLTVIDNTIDQTTGTVRLKATFVNDDERLWPGEFVNVRLTLQTRKGVPTVPAQTVQEGAEGKFVYVVKPNDTVERRIVDVADVQNGLAVIQKGLTVGETVVVDGQFRLVNGSRIKVMPAAPKAAG